METKTFTARLDLKEGAEEGAVRAAFSIFHTRDSVGDIVLPSFFQDGQEIPMAAWGHSWGDLPPGKGVIRVREKYAEFDGRFFMDTTHGLDHYRTVKHMGDLQEWSFGFSILDAQTGEQDGEPVRFLTRGDTFEASPVLVGAHRDTHTLAIKGKRRLSRGQIEAVITTLQALLGDDEAEELAESVAASSAADDGKAAFPEPCGTLAEDGEWLATALATYIGAVNAAPDADVLEAKDALVACIRRLGDVRLDLDARIKRLRSGGAYDGAALRRRFDELTALYGPVVATVEGPSRRDG